MRARYGIHLLACMHVCMHARGAAHPDYNNNSAIYCIQQGGACLGWRLRACATVMPSPSAMERGNGVEIQQQQDHHACQPWQRVTSTWYSTKDGRVLMRLDSAELLGQADSWIHVAYCTRHWLIMAVEERQSRGIGIGIDI